MSGVTKELFKRTVMSIIDHGEKQTRVVNDEKFMLYRMSEMKVLLSHHGNRWSPNGISFSLMGNEFFISPDGSVDITEGGSSDEIFSLDDDELLEVLASFLRWRLKVMDNLDI